MGVHLHFSSVEAVTPEVEQAIRAEAEHFEGPQPWVLCAPHHFYQSVQAGRLQGGRRCGALPRAVQCRPFGAFPEPRRGAMQ
jgi:hypothetical protein